MSPISIIIVSWNARSYLRDCLNSIRQTRGSLVHEVIVVDNASSDGSPEMVTVEFPEVILIRSRENLGFARANNLGLQRATGELLALINSDVVVHAHCWEELAGFLHHSPNVGLVGPKVIGRDGLLQLSCGRLPSVWNTLCQFLVLNKVFPGIAIFSGFQVGPKEHETRREVEVLSGCFWLARRQAVEAVGGLDECFFFYAEDVDWSKRFRDAGWKLFFVPEATATHFGGGSSANAPLRYYIEILRANLIYWKKHHGYLGRAIYYVLAVLQHAVRLGARWVMKVTGLADRELCNTRLREHVVCLRWLLTGKGL
jgi:GT2 family glycosyltransferase